MWDMVTNTMKYVTTMAYSWVSGWWKSSNGVKRGVPGGRSGLAQVGASGYGSRV